MNQTAWCERAAKPCEMPRLPISRPTPTEGGGGSLTPLAAPLPFMALMASSTRAIPKAPKGSGHPQRERPMMARRRGAITSCEVSVLVLMAIIGCEPAGDILHTLEEPLPPLTELEIVDQTTFSLELLGDAYQRRGEGLDDGVIVFGSQMPGDDDGIVALINRLFWLVVDEENLSPADGVERLTDLIAGYTGMAIDEVKKDVDRSLSTQIANGAPQPRSAGISYALR